MNPNILQNIEIPAPIQEILRFLDYMEAKAYLVGGGVIDAIRGLTPKDMDIEVFGWESLEYLEVLLMQYDDVDAKADVGKKFSVLKVRVSGFEIDISLPRREVKTGEGHTGFDVEVDHTMTVEQAAKRRDLTMNAIYLDLLTGELIDPYNGLEDFKNGVLRAVDPLTFVEDPLRVLRIMQLLPRKGKTVAPETIELCRSISHTFSELPKERVMVEFEKLMLKSNRPSLGIKFLFDCGWIQHFPEIKDLQGCPQHPHWHPEGDVLTHTLMVLDAAAGIRVSVDDKYKLAFMLSALLHDTGKPSTTNPETFTAHGHDVAGVPLAKNFLARMTNEVWLTNTVCELVRWHMTPGSYLANNASPKAWAKLNNKINLRVLGALCQADKEGVGGADRNVIAPSAKACLDYYEQTQGMPIPHLVNGRDIMARGFVGPEIGRVKNILYDLQLDGYSLDRLMQHLDSMVPQQKQTT